MKNNSNLAYKTALILGDFVALLAAFSLAYILRVKVDARPLITAIPARTYFWAFVTILPLWLVVHGFIGLYNEAVYSKRFSELGRLLIGSFLGILVVIGYDFVSPDVLFPARLVPVYALGIGFGFLVITRTVLRIIRIELFRYNFGVNRAMVIGDNHLAIELIESLLDTKHSGYKVVAVVGDKEKLGELHGVKVFKTFSEACEKLKSGSVYSIVQTELYADPHKNSIILDYAQANHMAYRFVPGNSDLFVGNIVVELFRSIPVIAVHQTALIGWGRVVKRLFDIAVSSILIVLTSPLMLLVAIAVKVSDPRGPVIMRGIMQDRLTRFNHVFKVYKFRSHYAKFDGKTDEEVFRMVGKPELIEEYRKNGDKLDKDFRVTPVGNFIRRTSLDELPQLFNVFKGDISLVGPRALVPHELNEYAKKHTILSVKSGITGLAQVSGRRDISFDERRKLDTYYVQNWSFWLDITIMLKTVRTIIDGIFAP